MIDQKNSSNDCNRRYSNNLRTNYSKNKSRKYSNKRAYKKTITTGPLKTLNLKTIANKIDYFQSPNYSQSPNRITSQYPNKQNDNNRSSTPKNQRQINQVQTTSEATPDPPGIENTESLVMQPNHKHCERTDDESKN